MALSPTSSRSSSAAQSVTLLSTTTLASDGTFDVASIDQTYNDLVMVLIARGTRAATADFLQMRFNNDSGANYASATVAAASGTTTSATSARISTGLSAATATASFFSMFTIEVLGYTSATWVKSGHSTQGQPTTLAAAGSVEIGMFVWNSTAAVNRVGFFGGTTANLLAGSVLRIYGRL